MQLSIRDLSGLLHAAETLIRQAPKKEILKEVRRLELGMNVPASGAEKKVQ